MNFTRLAFASASLSLALVVSGAPSDSLEKGFLRPPDSAKPQTWWHWMNGNISKAGITADLEAMKEIGLGGATIVNVDCGIPRGDVPFMSPAWREDFKFAIQEAHRLGLDMTVENCAGWSSSGGPWNTPEHAMQSVTASELCVTGPTNFHAALPQPPMKLDFYRDIAVLAFPVPAAESVGMTEAAPVASLSSGSSDARKILDGNQNTLVRLPAPQPGKPQFAQLEFAKSFAARAVKIVGASPMPECHGDILVSDDGKSFRVLKRFAYGRRATATRFVTIDGEGVTARFWRVQFTGLDGRAAAETIPLAEVELTSRLSIRNLEPKAGFAGYSVPESRQADTSSAGAIQRRDIIELTSKVSADGTLDWQVPAGQWIIQRFGYTPIGVKNHPAPEEGTGLECDKMSKEALQAHWDGFMQKVLDDVGPLAGKTLSTSLIDSYEVGCQNWTKQFRAEFKKRRGYDLLTFLPTFTGCVVENPAVSERFLWDVRRTIADLFAENYFGHFAELCRKNGLLNATEPYTGPFEAMQSGAPADVVMGEFWAGSSGHPSIKLASSIAHIYGKTIVGAESFTAVPAAGRWQNDPYALKALGDLMFCQGLNRYIFHRYAMQPWTNAWPGMTMGQWGFHFERTETWWKQGKPWIDYISRCEFLLQQGRSVNDAAYFIGESAPVDLRAGNPPLPDGYNYDAVNADVLLHGATVKNGRLTLASGANYAVLVLPPNDVNLTPLMLRKISELVRAGATVLGEPPQHSPSLTAYPECDAEIRKLVAKLWGRCDGKTVLENSFGKGSVVWGKSLQEIFAAKKLAPDFEFTGASGGSKLAFGHRVDGDADIYFVSNQRHQADTAEATFRVSGKTPELWNPETGAIERAPVWQEQDGRITVRLTFDPAGSVFVVFRTKSAGDHIVAVSSSGGEAAKTTAPGLEIKRAIYAATDGAGEMDVTARLSQLVNHDQLAVVVNNLNFGRDPANLHVKELRVDYVLDGKPGQVTVPENKTLSLASAKSLRELPSWGVSLGADDQPLVKAWRNVRVELRTSKEKVLHAEAAGLPAPQEVTGAWKLSFPPNWGAPASVELEKLSSWTDHANEGVRYFSGTATYQKEIEISADRLTAGRELWLDLGVVKNFAEVSLNGKALGVLWKPPFRVNLASAAKPGVNQLAIKVTNLWPNRLIGDEQLASDREWNGMQLKSWPQWFLDGKASPSGRFTFTTWHHWTKEMPLLESGLLGPVTLRTAELIPAK